MQQAQKQLYIYLLAYKKKKNEQLEFSVGFFPLICKIKTINPVYFTDNIQDTLSPCKLWYIVLDQTTQHIK